MYSAAGECEKLSAHPCRLFSLAEIQSATKDFDDELVIGQGGFGKVYKGQISSEEGVLVVAIKRMDSNSSQGELEFRAEIETLSTLRHCHLVSLIGYCDDNKELILVYEYMSNGTLYHHLHKAEAPLSWVQRIKIAIGAARGLDYLHTGVGTRHGIIHRDVKSSNILLDENWEALISDFGLSKIGPTNQSLSYVDASVKGTFGYFDPEYFYTRRLTRKTDVFAFGVVMFELLSGRLPVDIQYGEEQCSLVRWAKKCVEERKLDQMVDSNIKGKISRKCLRKFTQIAYDCLLSDPKERPTMTNIVASLQALLELQQKHDNSANSSGRMGFTWKIHKYLTFKTKQNSDEKTSSLTNKDGDDHGEMPHEHGGDHGVMPHQHGGDHGEMPHQHGGDHGEMPLQQGQLVARDLKIFTYDELKCASMDFGNDMRLGNGVHGKVYKGWVAKMTYSPSMHGTGLPIAIRRLKSYKHFDPDRLKEFCHPNIVKLIGYCVEGEEILLVHEFMSNGNLEDLLCNGAVELLPLVTKVKIGVGIARAIVFLQESEDAADHSFYKGAVSESQFYRYNILLDENYTAKLSDYDIPKAVYGVGLPQIDIGFDLGYYYPGCEPFQLQCNLSGFAIVFAELLTGRYINNRKKFHEINTQWPIYDVAELCLNVCNEVYAETQTLKFLKKITKNNTLQNK